MRPSLAGTSTWKPPSAGATSKRVVRLDGHDTSRRRAVPSIDQADVSAVVSPATSLRKYCNRPAKAVVTARAGSGQVAAAAAHGPGSSSSSLLAG